MKLKKNIFIFAIAFFAILFLNLLPNISYSADLTSINQSQSYKSLIKTSPEIQYVGNNTQSNLQLDRDVIEDVRIDNYENKYLINSDYTYTRLVTQKLTFLTKQGIENWRRDFFDYSPDTQSVELIEAYVVQPNGKKIRVTDENIFNRSSATDVPGFNNNLRISVVFPRLVIGAQAFVKWKMIQKKPSTVGLSHIESPTFSQPTVKQSIEIKLPKSLKLNWEKRGKYTVTDTNDGDNRIIKAVITNQQGRKIENLMVNAWDFDSIFIFSNLDSWEEIGRNIWDKWRDQVVITPEIKKLALQITKDQEGIEAATSIYNWVTQNIKYLGVYLNESSGYVPHTTTAILRNRYGDCKDYVLLMHTLLKAVNIQSFPAIVNSGNIYKALPLPTPWQFNHVIIYLPDYKIFADPTNIYSSFGDLDNSLSNKFIVLLTKKGLTTYTPKSSPQKNGYEMKALISIKKDATIHGQSELKYFGNLNSEPRKYFASDTPKQLAEKILANTREAGTGIIETSDLNNLNLPVTVKGKWISPYAVEIEDKIYFSTPVGISKISPEWLRGYITFGKRHYPFIAWVGNYNWEYKINIPSGYKIVRKPKDRNFSNTTGSYKSIYKQGDGYILVKRNLVINKSVYRAEEYPDFQELIYKPIHDIRSVIVLEKLAV